MAFARYNQQSCSARSARLSRFEASFHAYFWHSACCHACSLNCCRLLTMRTQFIPAAPNVSIKDIRDRSVIVSAGCAESGKLAPPAQNDSNASNIW
eukprot:6180122-Pleurochrysis_carterae.AAC.2